MAMQYYLDDNKRLDGWRTLIKVDEKDIDKQYVMEDLIYVDKENINDIESYKIGSFEDTFTETQLQDMVVISVADTPENILEYLDNYCGYRSLEDYNSDVEKDDIVTETDIENFLKQTEQDQINIEELPHNKVYAHWDGSNWKTIILETEYEYDTGYLDETERLNGMTEIDFGRYSHGIHKLYRLNDGTLILEDDSTYQGSLWSIYFIYDEDVSTVNEALEYIKNELDNEDVLYL